MMGFRSALTACFALSGLLLTAAPARAKPVWQTVKVPLLPEGSALGPLWAGLGGDLYMWVKTQGGPSKDVPTARLIHWDGDRWKTDLVLPGHEPAAVFGTSERDMFIGVNKCEAGRSAGCGPDHGGRIFRSMDGGATWTPQTLPPETAGAFLSTLDGSYNNIQAVMDGHSLVRFDGAAWSLAFRGSEDTLGRSLAITFQGPNEGYLVSCKGWGRWIDGTWKFMPAEFGFCDARGLWGLRDQEGGLQLFTIDNNRFSNGVRIWKFDPPSEDFNVVLEEESKDDWGSANGLWGSAQDDIYVIGQIGDGKRAGDGRVYHFDGKAWSRDASMGPIPAPVGIHGTSRNDVWITLADGRLLHYSTAVSLTRKMSAASASAQ